jgi:hypothetical protein
MPRRLDICEKRAEHSQIGSVERIYSPERHRQAMWDDREAIARAAERRGVPAAAAHVILRRDLEPGELGRGPLEDVVRERPT